MCILGVVFLFVCDLPPKKNIKPNTRIGAKRSFVSTVRDDNLNTEHIRVARSFLLGFLYTQCTLFSNVLAPQIITLNDSVVALLRIADPFERAVRELLVVTIVAVSRRVRTAVAPHVVHVHREMRFSLVC